MLLHYELRPSALQISSSTRPRCKQCVFTYVVNSFCPVSFSCWPSVHIPSQSDPYRPGVSRPVKSHSYRHSGQKDSIHHCCYECDQRSQFTEDNAERSFLPRPKAFHQFACPSQTHLRFSQAQQPQPCGLSLHRWPVSFQLFFLIMGSSLRLYQKFFFACVLLPTCSFTVIFRSYYVCDCCSE